MKLKKHVTYYSSLKIFFFLIERKSKLGHYQVKIENRKLRIPIGYLSRFSILNSYKDWVSNCQLTFEQYFTIIVERCMMLSQMQFHKLRLLFGHILGMQREIAVFIHLAHFCRFEVKTITPEIFENPLKNIIVLFLNTTRKLREYFVIIIAIGQVNGHSV